MLFLSIFSLIEDKGFLLCIVSGYGPIKMLVYPFLSNILTPGLHFLSASEIQSV